MWVSWEPSVASKTHLEAKRAKRHAQRARKTQSGSFLGTLFGGNFRYFSGILWIAAFSEN